MLNPEEALNLILKTASPCGIEIVELNAALNRVLAEDIISDVYLPPFDKAAMDGFAYNSADMTAPLKIVDEIPAGKVPSRKIVPGECARIMTGAVMPEGTNCVVPYERVVEKDGTIDFPRHDRPANYCKKGENIIPGQVILNRGERIFPKSIAAIASIGLTSVNVFQLPKVGVLSTGSELIPPGSTLLPAKNFDSNGAQIIALVQSLGMPVHFYGCIPDEQKTTEDMLKRIVSECDVGIISGGVSGGSYDFVPLAIKNIGGEIIIDKIAIKPGRPTVFAKVGRHFLFGLPGNPVAVFVIFELFVKPFLWAMCGHAYQPLRFEGILVQDIIRRNSDRMEVIPIRFDGKHIFTFPFNGPAHINGLRECNGLIEIPIGITRLEKGKAVKVLIL